MDLRPGSPVGDYVLMPCGEVWLITGEDIGAGFQPQKLRVRVHVWDEGC